PEGGLMPETFCRRSEPVERRVPSVPVTCAADALGVIDDARHRPERPEVIAVVVEDGSTVAVVVVDHARTPDATLDVVEFLVASLAHSGRRADLVVATVRPDAGPLPGDAERWMEASDTAADAGVRLLEWFVIGGDV